MSGRFRVVVDYDRCEGNARCVEMAPAVFRVDDRDQLHVLMEEPPAEHRAAVEAAVVRCPRQALSIDED
jgi:ferredoxin